ncbi:MAG: DUF6544 family protein [Thermoleophilia bacterium]
MTAARDPGGAVPPPVRRWLDHAVAPGSAPATAVELWMRGAIRLGGRWRPFRAREDLEPGRRFEWRASVGSRLLPVTGADRYEAGVGEMRWRLLGLVPVASGSGADVTRSAAGRLAAELVLCPPAAAGSAVRWRGIDDERALGLVDVDGVAHEVTIAVDRDGRLRWVTTDRWGEVPAEGFRSRPFTVMCDGEARVGGHLVPSPFRIAWSPPHPWGEEWFRAAITAARFR